MRVGTNMSGATPTPRSSRKPPNPELLTSYQAELALGLSPLQTVACGVSGCCRWFGNYGHHYPTTAMVSTAVELKKNVPAA